VSTFDNTKYDVELNGVGYRVRSITKSELPPFIPRLGSGDQTESEFDLLRAKTLEGFSGGILQRQWDTDANNSVYATEGLYPRYEDGVLYPVNEPVLVGPGGKFLMTAHCVNRDYYFRASISYNSPTVSIIRRDTSGTETSLTLPAVMTSGAANSVTSMVIWNGQLWIASGDGIFYMPLSSTTVTKVPAGSTVFQLMVVYRGSLYGTNEALSITGTANSQLHKYTGDTATTSSTLVGDTGLAFTSFTSRLLAFSGRIWLTRPEGLWSYDGVSFNPIDDTSTNVDTRNFRHACVLKGYLYYFMPDGFYRFNGALIEKLYDVSEIGFPADACVGKNRIWLWYANSADAGSSRYDKTMGYNNSAGYTRDGNILVFNGKALFGYRRTSASAPNPVDFTYQNDPYGMYWFSDKLWLWRNYDHDGYYDTLDTNEKGATGNKPWKLVTSVYDGEFPMIDKDFENLEAVLDSVPPSDQSITVEYRTSGFDVDTGWTSYGTIKALTRLQEYVYRSLASGLTYRRIQFRFSGTTDAGYGIVKLIFRYLLSPDFKFQWTVTLAAYGDNSLEPLVLRDGTSGNQAVSLLRGNVYDSRQSDTPVIFCDIDQLDLNGAHTNSITTITLYDTGLLKDRGFIKIDSELIYYTGRTTSTLTGCTRGVAGTTAAAHSNGAKIYPAYRVIVRQIQSERFELSDGVFAQDQVVSSSIPSDITVSLQEV
jgi:hypothetical protein